MKGIILLNGEPHEESIDCEGSFVVCCDGAYTWAMALDIKPDICVGDFDSLGYVPKGASVYPCEKDFTDGEIALNILLDKGIKEIFIYGGGGRREDHFMGNVGLLIKAREHGVKARMVTNYTEFYLIDKREEIKAKTGTTISLMPVTDQVYIKDSVGLKYSAKDLVISLGDSRGLSNVLTQDVAVIDVLSGLALLFIIKKD